MKQMILKVGNDFTEVPKGLNLSTAGQLVGSKSWYNNILILVLSPLGILELEDKFEELELDWEVVAIEDEPLNLNEISSYMNDVVIYDEEGEEIDSNPFSNLSTITNFAGHNWKL